MTTATPTSAFPFHDFCTRALSSPSSISTSERNLILRRPDPNTENSAYIAKTTLPLSVLVANALATPSTLSLEEAQVLVDGPVARTRAEKGERTRAYLALTDDQKKLLNSASNAVADKDEHKAGKIAYRLLRDAKAKELGTPKETTTIYDTLASTQRGPRPAQPNRKPYVLPWERADWITFIREKDYPFWGLPVLRTAYADPAAWLTFETRFSTLAARALACVASPEMVKNFSIQYIDDEDALAGAEQAGLLAYYARAVREEKVKEGYQWGVFISADENVLEIFGEERREWIVPVWEAAWTAGEVDKVGWNGALAMKADLVFAILMPALARGDIRPLEGLSMMATDR